MRPSTYPERIVFNDSVIMAAALRAKAARENVTLAEVMRRAVRREVRQAA